MKYVKRPIELEAAQFTGIDEEGEPTFSDDADWIGKAFEGGDLAHLRNHPLWPDRLQLVLDPHNPAPRNKIVDKDDWIVLYPDGTMDAIKPDEFEENHEAS